MSLMRHSCSFTLTLVFLLFLFFALWDRMGLRRQAATISANFEWGLFPEIFQKQLEPWTSPLCVFPSQGQAAPSSRCRAPDLVPTRSSFPSPWTAPPATWPPPPTQRSGAPPGTTPAGRTWSPFITRSKVTPSQPSRSCMSWLWVQCSPTRVRQRQFHPNWNETSSSVYEQSPVKVSWWNC